MRSQYAAAARRRPRGIHLTIPPSVTAKIRQAAAAGPHPLEDTDGAIAQGLKAVTTELPGDDLRRLIRFRADPHAPGVVIISGVPVDWHPGPTPLDGKPSRFKSTYISETVLLGFASLFGEVYAYAEEKNGIPVHDIVPVREKADSHSNAGSRNPLDFHTEAAVLLDRAPDVLLLHGIRSDHKGEALTLTADIRDALPYLTGTEIEILRGPNFNLDVPESFAENGCRHSVITSVLSGPDENPDLTVNFDRMTGRSVAATGALNALRGAFEREDVALRTRIMPGDLVIINNRRAAHGRTTFEARWDGTDRWLQRAYVKSSLWSLRAMAGTSYRVLSIGKRGEKIA